MSDLINVKGLAELQKFMDQLTPKVEANIMRGALRAGMNVVKPVAQHAIHNVSGELARGLKVGTRLRAGSKGGIVTASLRATGPHASVGILVEFGTQAHNIAARKEFLAFDHKFLKQVSHPGARAKPFMRPALDATAAAATVATGNYIKERLATQQGLDTAHVMVEGDRL